MEELLELLEGVTHASNAFLKSEISLNDGEVEECQKFSKEGQTLVKSMIKDTFIEIKENFSIIDESKNEYSYPNNLELVKSLNEVSMNVALYFSSIDDENVNNIFKMKIIKAINTVIEIYKSLFEN